ncbi:MAG: SDR family oxidoreductase [Lachnospiraceae bacterium]|nr:SDR family oxidoreductase [Lachnospiraceae bacterium]
MALDVRSNLAKLFSLEGKVVLLTGAAGGIGRELAVSLAKVGATMALADIAMDELNVVEKEITDLGGTAKSFFVDLMDLSSLKALTDEVITAYGKIDALINNAGINKRERLEVADEDSYEKILGINLKSVHFLSQEVVKHMKEAGTGSIVNVTSYNSVMMLGGCGLYGASKSGVAALTRAQAIELAKFGIRSNALTPGHIQTPLTAPLWSDPVRSKFLLDRIAMNRPGTPKDLVGMTVLLVSDASAYMSGMMYVVDGGSLAGGQPWEI